MANDLTFLSFIATIILYIRAMRKTESLGHPVESLRQVESGRMGRLISLLSFRLNGVGRTQKLRYGFRVQIRVVPRI